MICCKIISDFNSSKGNFTQLCYLLNNYGDVYFSNNILYFGDSQNRKTNEKSINRILKKAGYDKFFITVYNKENQPNETEEEINTWLNSHLLQINYCLYEDESQEVFRNILKGLDILDQNLQEIAAKQEQEKENEVN